MDKSALLVLFTFPHVSGDYVSMSKLDAIISEIEVTARRILTDSVTATVTEQK